MDKSRRVEEVFGESSWRKELFDFMEMSVRFLEDYKDEKFRIIVKNKLDCIIVYNDDEMKRLSWLRRLKRC